MSDIRLPSRYEDLDSAFRARLKPVPSLIDVAKQAYSGMKISGGIRFLPLYGNSGSGKTSAAMELSTHLPDCVVRPLPRECVGSSETLLLTLKQAFQDVDNKKLIVWIVDQYEEAVIDSTALPSRFVEQLSLLDRGELRHRPMLFIWLTTRRDFQRSLADATSRNKRILISPNFELHGPPKENWPTIIQETFSFHNAEKPLADYGILQADLEKITRENDTLGAALETVGMRLASPSTGLQDISVNQIVMLWPVTDGLRITRVQQFTDPRQGYKLNWDAWCKQLNNDEKKQYPLDQLNRTRLYFDLRLVPIAAADLHNLCKQLDNNDYALRKTYMDRLRKTHFFSIVSGAWNPDSYSPLRERKSKRADAARDWYHEITQSSVSLGKRLARCLTEAGVPAKHEQDLETPHAKIRTDVLARRVHDRQSNVCIELKAFSADNTMPSTIKDQIRITLRKYAQLAGFLSRQ